MSRPGLLATLAAALLSSAAVVAHAEGAGDGSSPTQAATARCARGENGDSADAKAMHVVGCLAQALVFDPSLYFRDYSSDFPNEPGGIVDARRSGRRPDEAWSFAIDEGCPGKTEFPPPCRSEGMRLLIRVATYKPAADIDREGVRPPREATLGAARAFLDAVIDWREADIKACPGAAATLLSLEHVKWFAFDDNDRTDIVGGQAELVVPGDGPSTVVRARGELLSKYVSEDWAEANEVTDWAKQMMKVVTPCLRPSKAPAPWDRD